ncbi:MAG TPA: 5'-3' exonuclease H3TH domain-containing protein, partial [Bryobacteraceae bacterium]|nr:5'-3' exonuclease H3TH domain-containing protein [Bryobacteraceae bacterium]
SIPDYLAVVGDSADGFPGIAGWGEKAAGQVLSRYQRLENIPKDWHAWDASIKNAQRLGTSLFAAWDDAILFRTLATLRLDAPVCKSVDDLRWKGPRAGFEDLCGAMKSPELFERAMAASSKARASTLGA